MGGRELAASSFFRGRQEETESAYYKGYYKGYSHYYRGE